MNKKIIAIGIIGMFLLTGLSVVGMEIADIGALGKTIYVDDDFNECPDADYTSIQDAIDDSCWCGVGNWDKIAVYPGIYEENIVVGKDWAVIVSVEGPENTVIEGDGTSDVVKLSANLIHFEGFTVVIDSVDHSGFRAGGIQTKIINCVVRDNLGNGISVNDDPDITIESCIIENNGGTGASCKIIKNCVIEHNVGDGISCKKHGVVADNIIRYNGGNGVICNDWSKVYNNVISDNKNGIVVKRLWVEIKDNTVSNNDIGIFMSSSDYQWSIVYNNILTDNNLNAYDETNYYVSQNIWGGNYWGDYEDIYNAEDKNNDDIWDYAYKVGDYNYDFYPLVDAETWPSNFPPHPPFIGGKKFLRNYEFYINAYDLDGDDFYLYVDWGDGTTTNDWLGPYSSGDNGDIVILNHRCSRGDTIIFRVKDVHGAEGYGTGVTISTEADYTASVVMPKNKQLIKLQTGIYVENAQIPFPRTIIIGDINIEVDAEGASKVELYIDEQPRYTDDEEPYEWLWNEFSFGRHTLKVIAYDNAGNSDIDEMTVWKFF